MKILHKNDNVEKDINKLLRGSDLIVRKKLAVIIDYFNKSKNFSQILDLKFLNPHQLSSNRSKQWAVKVDNTKYRVIFYLCNDNDEPIKEDNFDIVREAINITTLMILEVSNKHYDK